MSPSGFLRHSCFTAVLCCVILLMQVGCRLHSSEAEQLVIPEVVRSNLYVAANGSDAHPGTETQPFRTITRAAQVVTPGTTVYVAPGEYPGGFRTAVSGSPDARIVFQSTERRGAKLVPPPHLADQHGLGQPWQPCRHRRLRD